MSRGNVVCCVQMQVVQKEMDEVRMDLIPGVTSGPCVLHHDPGGESLNGWVTICFHYLKHHDCFLLVLGLRCTDLHADFFCLPLSKGIGAWARDCARPWPWVSVSWLLGNTASWADLSWPGGRARSSDHLSADGGISWLWGGQKGADDLWNCRSLSLATGLR